MRGNIDVDSIPDFQKNALADMALEITRSCFEIPGMEERYCLVRFYENVAPFSETQGELTISGFEYDEYYLELPFYDGIYDDILGSFDGYFAQAKLAEAEKETIPKLKQQVSDLQSVNEGLSAQITQAQLALCDVYELVIGG